MARADAILREIVEVLPTVTFHGEAPYPGGASLYGPSTPITLDCGHTVYRDNLFGMVPGRKITCSPCENEARATH